MIKKLLLASAVAVGGLMMSTGVAKAGDPDCFYPRHHGHGGYHSHRPVYVAPLPVYRHPSYGSFYGNPYRSGFGYGVPAYRSYRPAVGIGVGGGHPFYGGHPYYGGFGGGSGFSLYIGR